MQQKHTPEPILRRIFEDFGEQFSGEYDLPHIASHINAPPDVLSQLVYHPIPATYIAALKNPRLPLDSRC
jgi:hypothetical protein